MANDDTNAKKRINGKGLGWKLRIPILLLIALAVALVWITNHWLTIRFAESTRTRAELRLALFSGNIVSELKRTSVVPLLLSSDPFLINALNSDDFTNTSQRLISYIEDIGAKSLALLDETGRVVAASDRSRIGTNLRQEQFFIDTIRASDTVFLSTRTEAGGYNFTYSRRVMSNGAVAGVIVVGVDLDQFPKRWAGIADAVVVTDSEGRVIVSTLPRWRGLTEEEALAAGADPSPFSRALKVTRDWAALNSDAFVSGAAVLRNEARVPFQGWRIISYSSFASVREKVNAVLSLEIMAFAIILSLAFYLMTRRAQSQSVFFQRESEELRNLNNRLQREIAEREKAEKNLEVAEQSLQQSSKLAALGEMSAAVSHELNQPLAAMKTYLAGARLLLQRRRGEEALSSFQRIDDLIERMGSITRQLKSYARKGGDAFEPIDFRTSVSAALSMMEPQLKTRKVDITNMLPREPVMVMADRVRLEQVIINLLRNALDATKARSEARIDLILSKGETATLVVRDNGFGIDDLDALFEPFYTTKQPGDGLGLGLAISSGIVSDLGGRLTARNGRDGGAVFEMQLPILGEEIEAA